MQRIAELAEPATHGCCRRSRTEAETRLELLVGEHRADVYSYCLRWTGGDAGWAEDVVQETFVRAWKHWESMTPEHGSVRAWLLRVAHNVVMDGYRLARRRRPEVPLEYVDDEATPEPSDQILTSCVVRSMLGLLPEPNRIAIEATYLRDQTTVQAAKMLDIPVGTVKTRVFYGLRMLRSVIEPAGAVAVG